MERLKQVLNEYSATELAEFIFRDLSPYQINKFDKAVKLAQTMSDDCDYEDKTEPKTAIVGTTISPGELFVGEAVHKAFEHGYTVASEQIKTEDPHIKKAQEIIDEEIADWAEVGSYVKFVIDEDNRTVKAVVRDKETGEVDDKGTAICNKTDKFNPTIGKMIALYKASYSDWKEMLINKGFKHLFI